MSGNPKGKGLRGLGVALVGVLVLLGAAGALLYPRLPGLAERLALDVLAESGIPEAALTIERLDTEQLVITGLRLGPDDETAARIASLTVSYSPRGLWERRIERVDISGLELAARLEDGRLSLGPLDPLLAGDSGDTKPVRLPVTVGALHLEDAVATLVAPEGNARIELAGEARHRTEQTYAGALRFAIDLSSPEHGEIPVRGRIAFEAAPDRLDLASADLMAKLPPLPFLTGADARLVLLAKDGGLIADLELNCDQGSVLAGAKLPLEALARPQAASAQADVTLALEGFGDGMSVRGAVDLSLAPDGITLRPTSAVVLRQADVALEVSPSDEPVLRMPFDSLDLHLVLPDARLEAAGQALALWDLEAVVDPEGPGVTLKRVEVRHSALEPLVAPLEVSGSASREGEGGIGFSVRLGDPLGRLVFEVEGRHDEGKQEGKATVRLHPLRFVPGALQPEALFPVAAGLAEEVAGELSAEGPVSWKGGELASDIRADLRDLSFSLGGMRFEGTRARITLDAPWPPSTPPRQRIVVARLDGPLPLEGLDVSFQVAPGPALAIDGVWARLAGGVVSVGPVTLPLGEERQEVVLGASGLDLQSLIDLFEIADTEARGSLYGAVPVILEGGRLGVADAILETDGSGVLRYSPAVPPGALQSGGQGASLMMQALENFHYEGLRLAADRDLGGDWEALLNMTGANPDLMEGYPFTFNVNLSGKLDEILRRGLESVQLPQALGSKVISR